jgi:hypothetical protein
MLRRTQNVARFLLLAKPDHRIRRSNTLRSSHTHQRTTSTSLRAAERTQYVHAHQRAVRGDTSAPELAGTTAAP